MTIHQLIERVEILNKNINSLKKAEDVVRDRQKATIQNNWNTNSFSILNSGFNLDVPHMEIMADILEGQRNILEEELERHLKTLEAVNLIVKGANA